MYIALCRYIDEGYGFPLAEKVWKASINQYIRIASVAN